MYFEIWSQAHAYDPSNYMETLSIENVDKEFWKWDGESSGWGYMTNEHRNAITLSAMEGWKNGRLNKELSQFDNKKPEELEPF